MISSLNGVGPRPNLDLSLVKSDARRRLFQLLDKFEGEKTIVFDDNLIGPLEFVAEPKALKQHGAKLLLRLSDIKLTLTQSSIQNTDHTLFMVRKDYQLVKNIADVLLGLDRTSWSKISLVFVPQRCASIEKMLGMNKIDITKLNSIEQLDIQLFLLDTDLLSMENETVYRDIHLNDDHSQIHQIVEGLSKVEQLYGHIPRISGQGKAAKLVHDLLIKRRELASSDTQVSSQPKIHQLILIDRRIDLVTPLLTQLTYQGLLDELFEVKSGNVTMPAEIFQKTKDEQSEKEPGTDKKVQQQKVAGNRKFPLRSSEELFAKLRDCHINGVGEMIKQSAIKLRTEREECKGEGTRTIHEMGMIVKRIQHLKMAEISHLNHVSIAELVHEQTHRPEFIYGLRIEHEILEQGYNRIHPDIDIKLLRQEPPLGIIRLICLQSMLINGLKPKISEQYKAEIIQNYGHNYLQLLIQLERAHIWQGQEKFYDQGYFSQVKNKFNLMLDDVDERNPSHFSYVYGGYSPLSIVVANMLSHVSNRIQFKSVQENLRMLSPPTFSNIEKSQVGDNLIEVSETVLVFFIGGCTFAEISALRQLAQQDLNEYIVGTTGTINGNSFLSSFWPISSK